MKFLTKAVILLQMKKLIYISWLNFHKLTMELKRSEINSFTLFYTYVIIGSKIWW